MSDVIAPIVADVDDPSSSGKGEPANGPLPEIGAPTNGAPPVRKMRSGASSVGQQSSRLDHLKISTIRQHYYPEGGWGWVVCVCAFLVNALTSGLLLSYGIFNREVLHEFGQEHEQQAMWLGCTSVSLSLLSSPIIVGICRRKSTRLTAVFGGLVAALGCLFTSFASQMHQVFLSYGLVMAIGLSLARVTSFLMIGQYFKRRREKVEAVVISGIGCGIVLFSYSFTKIIRMLGWRLGLHAVTGLAAAPFFLGICYRSASLYHPQRRAILHLKNQRKKIKDRTARGPPFFDWSPLRSATVLLCMFSAALCAPAIYAPFFQLIPLVVSSGLGDEELLLLQLQLGAAFTIGCWCSGILLSRRGPDCLVGCKQLCQAAMVALGLAHLSSQAAQGYAGFSLFTWLLGWPCGILQHALRMMVMEKGRAKSFSRTWAFVEWAQGLLVLLGIPAINWLNTSQGLRSGFYLAAACSLSGAVTLTFLGLPQRRSWRGGTQGSCSTCTSQAPSCCCTQDLNITHSRQDSSGSHQKCQKTISFSDTVDVADDLDSGPHEAHDHIKQSLDHRWDDDMNDYDGDRLDVDNANADVNMCYDDDCVANNVTVVMEDRKLFNRYGCGHLLEDDPVVEEKPAAARQMTVIEEVTSSV
ncbi:monocarboxylate transporter 13-like [Uloborus diversus]|uniref:monocarboxylate transporter 13-like n=1 Tax=Uloborus diversus TaxID=327109 RepID=UPI002409923F|nr:monocarboxylate transporter 13-like [Uloborus diversus]